MSLNNENLLDIVFRLNNSVLSPEDWPSALKALADHFSGASATFELIDKPTGEHLQYLDSSKVELQHEYVEYYVPINPRIALGRQGSPRLIDHDHMIMSEADMDKNEFYADFLRPLGLRYFASVKVIESARQIGVFTIQRPISAGMVQDEELAALSLLAPAMKRIALLQARYNGFFSRIQELEMAVEHTEEGIVVLNRNGNITQINSAAKDIFDSFDGLSCVNGKLVFSEVSFHDQLNAILEVNSHHAKEVIAHQMLVRRPSGLPPYRLRAQKIEGTHYGSDARGQSFILFVDDPSRGFTVGIDDLVAGFGLSPAEAHIGLLIASGSSATEIAQIQNVTLPTVRTHIQNLIKKLNVKRQIDAVRILSSYVTYRP